MDVFIGVAGASGAAYARAVAAALVSAGHTVGLSFSGSGAQVVGHELYGDLRMPRDEAISRFVSESGIAPTNVWGERDYGSPYASGSARWDAAVIIPCSMSTLAQIAQGAETNLVQRAANVALKERRRLIVVPRETPLSQIQLENLLRLSRAGADIVPAMPGFYHHPQSVDDIIDFVAGKVLNLLGVEQDVLREWHERDQPSAHHV